MKTFSLASAAIFDLFICCFCCFCSDTFGNDPPLNAPKLLVGAKLTLTEFEAAYKNGNIRKADEKKKRGEKWNYVEMIVNSWNDCRGPRWRRTRLDFLLKTAYNVGLCVSMWTESFVDTQCQFGAHHANGAKGEGITAHCVTLRNYYLIFVVILRRSNSFFLSV